MKKCAKQKKAEFVKELWDLKPYNVIKPRMKETFVAKESLEFSPTNKKKALMKTMKSFNDEKKRPRSFYEHTLKIYEGEKYV